MTTVSSLSHVVESAVNNTSTNVLHNMDINRILVQLEQDIGKDLVTLAELQAIDSTLDRLVRNGKITQQRADGFSDQIRGAINRAVEFQNLKAADNALSWLRFSATEHSANAGLRQMAREAANSTDRHSRFFGRVLRQRINDGEAGNMLKEAAKDGKITLSEINAMYRGIGEAFNAGEISKSARNKAIAELEMHLKNQAGRTRKGGCGRRLRGPYAQHLTKEAKDFIQKELGGKAHRSRRKGWTTWRFDTPRVQQYTRAICKDGTVSATERQALINSLLRDGRVTFQELTCVRQAFAWAVKNGDITREEYNRTLRIFDIEIAKQVGGIKADTLMEEAAIRRGGLQIIPG